MLAMFAWDRVRYDLVAPGTLLIAVAVGIVDSKSAFRGFSDDIVIIVGTPLIVVFWPLR